MLLENKNAVIYGGGESIGGAVAREFAGEPASSPPVEPKQSWRRSPQTSS